MIRINLLPVRQAKKKEQGRKQLVLAVAVIVLAVALNGFWWWSKSTELADGQAEVKRLRAEIQLLEKIIGEVNTITKDKKALEDKLAILDRLKNGRAGSVKALDALATIMPKRTWLEAMEEKGGSLSLRGGAVTNEDIADLIRELRQSSFFVDPKLKKTMQRVTKGPKYFEYEILCKMDVSA